MSDALNIIIAKLGAMAGASNKRAGDAASSFFHVGDVIVAAPRFKMTGIRALSVVALVADKNAFWDRAIGQSERRSVRGPHFLAKGKVAVSSVTLSSGPRPALVWPTAIYAEVESAFKRAVNCSLVRLKKWNAASFARRGEVGGCHALLYTIGNLQLQEVRS